MFTKMQNEKGFTLIELMIVVAIIGILAAVAIPGYIGFQEKSRRGAIIRTAGAAEAEIQGWLSSAQSTGTRAGLTEVDTDYDGSVTIGTDLTNSTLGSTGVAAAYVTARSSEKSPWSNAVTLYKTGAPGNGQIGLTQTGNNISIVANDNDGIVVFTKTVSAD